MQGSGKPTLVPGKEGQHSCRPGQWVEEVKSFARFLPLRIGHADWSARTPYYGTTSRGKLGILDSIRRALQEIAV